MAQRGIREYHAKKMLAQYLPEYSDNKCILSDKVALVTPTQSLEKLADQTSWITSSKLVVKVDQLIGKRGKQGLILLNATFEQAKRWLKEKMETTFTIGNVQGTLTHFLIEPYMEHKIEYYVAIKDHKDGDYIYFSIAGGVDIEENWEKVLTINIPIGENIENIDLFKRLSKQIKGEELERVESFIKALFKFYKECYFTFLELNPFTFTEDGSIIPLDTVARIDDTAAFWVAKKWGDIEFPAPFGRIFTPEENFVKELDEKTGASLKLTVLNPKGRIWTLVAGGGASIIYTDTVVDLGFGKELANYGEYSGNPSTDETYEYAKTILDLMTREKNPKGKILIIGGGIANFTDVADTFKGIVKALKEYKEKLLENKVKIYLRRGGPNYQEGLRLMREVGKELGIPMEVHGPEMHMTRIVKMALE
jgi:ATP-citrate lyase beta-subunit